MHKAAGGTSQRLNPGCATMRSLDRNALIDFPLRIAIFVVGLLPAYPGALKSCQVGWHDTEQWSSSRVEFDCNVRSPSVPSLRGYDDAAADFRIDSVREAEARRMGGIDKGLQPFRGRPLISWVVERFEPQVAEVMVSANRNLERYLAFGIRVAHRSDRRISPARWQVYRRAWPWPAPIWWSRCPATAPLLPADLVADSHSRLEESGADVADSQYP